MEQSAFMFCFDLSQKCNDVAHNVLHSGHSAYKSSPLVYPVATIN